jgi:deoxyribodipyrimidine photo-lyase
VITYLARRTGATRVFCEAIPAPEEIAEVAALRAAGLEVQETWQSSLLDPADLPFAIANLPEVFTRFRQAAEAAGITPPPPVGAPDRLPSPPPGLDSPEPVWTQAPPRGPAAFPFGDPAFNGSEAAAQAHLGRYFASGLPQTYKATRNGLIGPDYSTKFSPWLATGALSARSVFEALRGHEDRYGANESTYWILFELLWRDFFRFWSLKHGQRLFRARGLGDHPPPRHDPEAFAAWREGRTGHAFIDAAMRELKATGYLSNRMRQVVASYLIHDLRDDWRAGAAWFESRLIDYDVCSNQGNWLYLAGRGADPRQGRRFNPDKQASDYDPDGAYRRLWSTFEVTDLP